MLGASCQRWREAKASRETGGHEAGTKHQIWRVHIGVSFGERFDEFGDVTSRYTLGKKVIILDAYRHSVPSAC